jgi:hypothetical protein
MTASEQGVRGWAKPVILLSYSVAIYLPDQ